MQPDILVTATFSPFFQSNQITVIHLVNLGHFSSRLWLFFLFINWHRTYITFISFKQKPFFWKYVCKIHVKFLEQNKAKEPQPNWKVYISYIMEVPSSVKTMKKYINLQIHRFIFSFILLSHSVFFFFCFLWGKGGFFYFFFVAKALTH